MAATALPGPAGDDGPGAAGPDARAVPSRRPAEAWRGVGSGLHHGGRFDDAPFIRACRGLTVERVPVWFMRQAGRSLPEYRAARGPGSILDAIAQPELVARLTRQPVDRYGTDAAIFFSDIVVPVAAIGFGVDVAPATGPVVAAAVPGQGRPPTPPAARARDRHPLRHRGRGHPRRRAGRVP